MTAPTYSRGVAKTLTIGPETSFGTPSSASGQQLRRTSSDLNLQTQELQSAEILPSQQMRDSRQGPRLVQGTLAGQLHPVGYASLFENIMRSSFAAPGQVAYSAMTDTAATVDGNGNLVFTSGSVSFYPNLHVGDVVRLVSLTGSPAVDNNENLRVVAASQHSLTLAPPVNGGAVGWASGQTDSLLFPGKRLIIPATGQADNSFTAEHWYSDTGVSDMFTGCKVTSIALNIPASGFVTMQASVTGQNMTTTNTQHFPGAAAPVTTTGLTAVSGQIAYAGKTLSYFNAMNLQISAQVGNDPVIGSNLVPQIFLGTLGVRGSLTALMTNDTMTADYLAENEVSLSMLLTDSPSLNANFIEFHLPRVKLLSSTKNDSDRAITRSYNFVALENTGSVAGADLTTMLIHDSQLS